jgi:transcriptional regulator with XRE-family HTH domain
MTVGTKKQSLASREQCRKARAWLGWTLGQLAMRAHVSDSTVRDYETGRRTPIESNLRAITGVLEAAGLSFESGAIAIKESAKIRANEGRLKPPGGRRSRAAPSGTGQTGRRRN